MKSEKKTPTSYWTLNILVVSAVTAGFAMANGFVWV